MQLIVDQSLATGFIPINTQQQRASLSFKSGVLEKKVYNNDNITFFSVIMFSKPLCDNVLQRTQLCGSCFNTSHSSWAKVDTWKRMFYPLSKDMKKDQSVIYMVSFAFKFWLQGILTISYTCAYRPIHLNLLLQYESCKTDCFLVVMLDILALL